MNLFFIKRAAQSVALLFLLLSPVSIFADFLYINDDVISKKATPKIEEMGKELYEKTGVKVYLIANQTLDGQKIKDYEREISKNFKSPFILLCFSMQDQQVDIFSSDNVKDRFDKEGILSPFTGSIIPILVTKFKKDAKNENDKYTVALFNGYADIVEQVAESFDVKLDSGIGNTNRDIYRFIKLIFYGTIIFFILYYFYFKLKGKKNE